MNLFHILRLANQSSGRRLRCARWNHSSAVKKALQVQRGQKMHGFIVEQVEEVPELHLAALRLSHEATGADYLHVAREDSNNLFSVALRTLPENSTGVVHILEHLSLCGSEKYPCRDPFFKMHSQSLATFMNAFTGSDYTMYPFSSQNKKDFENLLRVYLDAVFFPRLAELDFRQEGWRLEHSDVKDKNSPIIIKGVVYNEMKGVFSDSQQKFARNLLNKMFPTGAYRHESGGDPLEIPDLTWEYLKEFHRTHYHPSNARFLTYGNFSIEDHLSLINELVLSKFSKISVDNQALDQPSWNEPRKDVIYCVPDPMAANPEKQSTVCMSYLLDSITNTYESFALTILGHLLVNGPNSPFYKNLLESGLGADYAPTLGYDADTKQATFSVGLYGIKEDDVEKVCDIIKNTFEEVIRDGFPPERIEAAMHAVELSLKHHTPKFGLGVTFAVNRIWNHGGDPVEALQINKYVNWFKEQLQKNPRFLQDKVEFFFKNNFHNLTLTMKPDSLLQAAQQEEEKQLLEKKLAGLTEADKDRIFEEGLRLSMHQQEKDDASCLPKLFISDVDPALQKVSLKHFDIGGVSVQTSEQPTNGVTYFRAVLDTSNFPSELKNLLPLFCEVATKMGAGDKSYREFDQEVELKTGGLSTSLLIADHPITQGSFEQGVLLTSYCLEKNTEAMFNLWKEIMLRFTYEDSERLFQLIQMHAASLAQSIAQAGHQYAIKQSGSSLSASGQLKEEVSGMSQITHMKRLAEATNHDNLLPKLKAVAALLFNKSTLRCALNSGASGLSVAENELSKLLSSLPGMPEKMSPAFVQDSHFQPSEKNIHNVLPFSVNYCAKSYPAVPYTHSDYPSLYVASKLLTHKYLHREIREKGGAYGGGSFIKPGGNFSFYSYRDPNLEKTLDTFAGSIQWLKKGEIDDKDLEEAKLSCFAEVDCPVAPGDQGMYRFLSSLSDDMRQACRQRLFAVTKDDVISAVTLHLKESETSSVAVLGPENEYTGKSSSWIVYREGGQNSPDEVSLKSDLSQPEENSSGIKSEIESVSSVLSMEETSVVRIRGLPWSVTTHEILQFFEGHKIRGGTSGIHFIMRSGRPAGEAYIELETSKDALECLKLNRKLLGNRYIEVFESSRSEAAFNLAEKANKSVCMDDAVIRIKGISYECKPEDVKGLFSDFELVDSFVPVNKQGQSIGWAILKFSSPDVARQAMIKNKSVLKGRYVDLFFGSQEELDSLRNAITDGSLPLIHFFNIQTSPVARPAKMNIEPVNTSTSQLSTDGWRAELSPSTHHVLASGLPFRVSEKDLCNFFWPLRPVCIKFISERDGRPSGKVLIQFRTHEEAISAMKKHKSYIGPRYVDLFLFSNRNDETQSSGISTF